MDISDYIGRKKRHKGYLKTVQLYEQLRVPAEGEYRYFDTAIRRNAEGVYTQEFRRQIFVELAKETLSQIFTCISKIRRSSDWSVDFPKETPSFIPEKETLKAYTEKYFPHYTTFEQYVFSVLLKNYLIDANAVILIMPLEREQETNEYARPYPYIFNSTQVLDYKEGEYAVFEVVVPANLEQGTSEEKYYISVDEETITWHRKGNDGYNNLEVYEHKLGVLPCFKMRGRFFKTYQDYIVNESPIQTVAPRLKEFDREYGDLQGAVWMSLYPEKWQWATQLCMTCAVGGISTGFIWIDDKGNKTSKATKKQVICPQCHGNGQIAASPYMSMVIRPSKKNQSEQDAPIPPAGYITKPIDIIQLQNERCNEHTYKALCSINMQFLMKVPQNESGYAKDVDREELNNFAYACAEDIVWMMDKCYYLFAKYRYRVKSDGQSLSDNEIVKLLPKVAVPQKFDLISENYLIDELERAQRANLNPLIMAQLNLEYGVKHFYNEPQMRDILKVVMQLDPLAGLKEDDKMLRLQNEGISIDDYILSSNIYPFVIRAIDEKEGFMTMKPSEQVKILAQYTKEKKTQIQQTMPAEAPVREDLVLNG